MVQVEANLVWLVARDPDDGHWLGVCQAINATAMGDTWGDFQQCAEESIQLLFEDLFRSGELEAFLRRNGWSTTSPLPAPGTRVRFDVPFSTERRQRADDVVAAATA